MRRREGFTLIELLVSVILMIILLSAVTLIFVRTTETVAISQARTTVYTNARYAIDIMENDMLGCLQFSGNQQRFILENGRTNLGGPPTSTSGFHIGQAADLLAFRTTTMVGNSIQTAEIHYYLIQGSSALPTPSNPSPLPGTLPGPAMPAGDLTRGQTVDGSPRPLYTLVRRVRVQDPMAPANWDRYPIAADGVTVVPDTELCYFVVSFNIEYLANNMSFSQLDAGSGPGNSPCSSGDPLGDGLGANDGAGGNTPLRVPFIRITLVIVEDVKARQEREIQKTIWIPMG